MFATLYPYLFVLFVLHCNGGLIPIKLDSSQGNKGNLEFALQLPNNDTVQIDLSFKLLTVSPTLPIVPNDDNNTAISENSTTTTESYYVSTGANVEASSEAAEPKYVTVDEAIEAFRQELIRKESEIAGIIESNHPFYRHFKLQFTEQIDLTIRCTYDSNFKKRSLNISCYEYHEYETERILSNGEVELIRLQDTSYKTDVELIDARNVKQVYTMEIS